MKKTLPFFVLSFVIFSFSASIKVSCVGNSITEGWRGYPSYVPTLQNILGSNYEVLKMGRSGATVLKKGDTPYWDQKVFNQTLSSNSDIITIMLGANDSKSKNWDSYGKDFKADYTALIDTLQATNKNAQILPVFPAYCCKSAWGIRENIIKEQITIIKEIAKEKGLTTIDAHTPLEFDTKCEYSSDGVHPNQKGADSLAGILAIGIRNAISGPKPESSSSVKSSSSMISSSSSTIENPASTLQIAASENCKGNGAGETANNGFESKDYFNFENYAGAAAEYKVKANANVQAKLLARFANGGSTPRSMSVSVNGTNSGNFQFATGSWTTWTTESISVSLVQGSNHIVLTSTSSDGGPNLDWLRFDANGLSIDECETVSSLTSNISESATVQFQNNILKIKTNHSEKSTVVFMNTLGQELFRENLSGSNNSIQLSEHHIPIGIYMVKVMSENHESSVRIIKYQ